MLKKSNYGIAEKQIFLFLYWLPSVQLLDLAETKAQIQTWFTCRYFQRLVSLEWKSRHTGEDDVLSPMLKAGEIDKDTYERCLLVVDLYEQMWGLIRLAEPHLRTEFRKLKAEYPFNTSLKLFTKIVGEDVDDSFSICLKPYCEVSGSKREKAYRLTAEGCKKGGLNFIQEKLRQSLLNQHSRVVWLELVLLVCEYKSSKDSAIRGKLRLFNVALANLCDKEATISRKAGSFVWKKGEKFRGKRQENYAKEPEQQYGSDPFVEIIQEIKEHFKP